VIFIRLKWGSQALKELSLNVNKFPKFYIAFTVHFSHYSVLPTKCTNKNYFFIVLLVLMYTPTRVSVLGPSSSNSNVFKIHYRDKGAL
jgi:hypothetical protein